MYVYDKTCKFYSVLQVSSIIVIGFWNWINITHVIQYTSWYFHVFPMYNFENLRCGNMKCN